MFKKTLLGAVVAAGSLISLVPTAANAQYTAIVATTAPPPPIAESVPEPRRGYVWAPGHYEWRGNQYVWVRGHWLADRAGYEYREPRWVQRANGDWVLVGNTWERRGPYGDRDRDGIANRYDRDKDGDGIPNARDERPNRDQYARADRRAHRFGPYGDIDRDGIENQDDRDRDGDGVRNHRDRYPNDPDRD